MERTLISVLRPDSEAGCDLVSKVSLPEFYGEGMSWLKHGFHKKKLVFYSSLLCLRVGGNYFSGSYFPLWTNQSEHTHLVAFYCYFLFCFHLFDSNIFIFTLRPCLFCTVRQSWSPSAGHSWALKSYCSRCQLDRSWSCREQPTETTPRCPVPRCSMLCCAPVPSSWLLVVVEPRFGL